MPTVQILPPVHIIKYSAVNHTETMINGKAIRIEGGNYTRNICPVKCLDCEKQWNESYENFEKILNGELNCPECNSKRIVCFRSEKKKFCRRNCWRHGG